MCIRDSLYVTDAARAIVTAAENYDGSDPVNLGSGWEVTIKELAEQIAKIVGFDGQIVWDATKPNGQPRRRLDTSRAEKLFGFKAKMSLSEGLQETISWYQAQSPQLVSTSK